MKTSALIERLTALVAEHGDRDVFLDTDLIGLHQIHEVDVDAEDTGVIIWGDFGRGDTVNACLDRYRDALEAILLLSPGAHCGSAQSIARDALRPPAEYDHETGESY